MLIRNSRLSLRKKLALSALIAGSLAWQAAPANAANYYWDSDATAALNNALFGTNMGGTGTWNTSGTNWFNAIAGTDGAWPNLLTDNATFSGAAGTVTVDAGGINVGALRFLTNGYTLSGGQITLGLGGTNVFSASGVTSTISSVIAGSNGLGLTGPGTLVLNGATTNTYTGTTSITNGGTLNLNFANSTSGSDIINSASSLALNGGTLLVNGLGTMVNAQTFASTSLSGGGSITLNQNAATSLTVGLGAITRTTGGTLSFANIPATTGIIATTSNANANGILGTWANVGATGTLSYATVNGSNQIVAYTSGTAAADGSALTDTTGAVNYDLAAGGGTVPDSVSANTIRYTAAGDGTITPGATLFQVNGLMQAGTGTNTLTIAGPNPVTIGANQELVVTLNDKAMAISSPIANNALGASGLTLVSGGGALTLSGVNTYTGPTTVNSGTLNLGVAGALNSASALVVNGGSAALSTFAQSVASVTLKNGTITGSTTGVLTNAGVYDVQSGSISASLAGTGGMIKSGPGQVTLNNGTANTFTGGVQIKAGTLFTNNGNAVSVPAANTVTIGDTSGNADARWLLGGTVTSYGNNIILASGTTGTLSIGSNNSSTSLNLSGTITGNNHLFLGNGGGAASTATVTFSGAVNIGGTITAVTSTGNIGAFTFSQPLGALVTGVNQNSTSNPLVITGNNLYSGPTKINGGTLTLAGATSSLANSAVTATSGSTFIISGNSTIGTAGNSGSISMAGNTTLSTVGSSVNTVTINYTTPAATVLSLGDATGATLNMEVGATSDQIVLGSGLKAAVGAGGVTVNINAISSLSGTPQTLISAPGGGLNTGGGFTLNTASGNFGGATLGLTTTSTQLQLTQTPTIQNTLYFKGNIDAKWNTFTGGNTNNSNWTTDADGTTDGFANPSAATDVHFYTTNATLANLSTTLNQPYSIKTLTVDGGALSNAVTIASGTGGTASTLTITPAAATSGIAVNAGAGAVTISAPIVLGASQTWTVDTAGAFLANGGISGTGDLIIKNNNTTTIGVGAAGAINNNTGMITSSGTGAGIVNLAGLGVNSTGFTLATQTAGATTTISNTSGIVVGASGKLFVSTSPNTLTLSGAITGTGNLTYNANGVGTITASGAINSTSNIMVSGTGSGLVTLSGAIASTVGNITFAGSGTTTATMSTSSINNTGLISNIGTTTGVTTISGVIGANVTGVLQNSPTSTLTLSGVNPNFNSGLVIKAGTVSSANTAGTLGANTNLITLGDTAANTNDVILIGGSTTAGITHSNPILLGSGTTGNVILRGPGQNGMSTFAGDITGTNNLVLSAPANRRTSNLLGGLHLSGNINNSGSITNTGTNQAFIDGTIGPNVTSLIQGTGSDSLFIVNAPIALTATNRIFVSNGIALFTLAGGMTGNQNVVFNANSTGGITASTVAINNTGTISTSGTGTGVTTISSLVGTNVTGINHNSVGNFVLSGGVDAMTGNITFAGTGTSTATISTAAVNNIGTIINSGTTTGTSTISAGVSSNVTGLIQNSTTSAMTVSGALSPNATVTNLTNLAGTKLLTLTGGTTGTGNVAINNNSSLANGITFTTGSINHTGTLTNSGTGTGAETIGVVIGSSVTNVIQNSLTSGLILTGTNAYSGATNVLSGALTLSGAGTASGTGVNVNGSTAKFIQTSSVAVTPTVTLNQGTIDGTTTISTVNVPASGAAATKVLTAGNGAAGTLTVTNLTFNGPASVNVTEAGAAVNTKIATTSLVANGAAGDVVINVSNNAPYVAGSYDLITYAGTSPGLSKFSLNASGVAGRQTANLFDNPGAAIQLVVTGAAASIVWTGATSSEWSTATLAAPKNWTNAGSPDDFFTLDTATFDDTATSTTVNLAGANINPTSTTFNNTTAKNYSLGSTGGFGIANGNVLKTNTGTVTLTSANVLSSALLLDRGSIIANANQTLTSLTFGSTDLITTAGTLDATNANITVNGLFRVQTNSSTANNVLTIGPTKTVTLNGDVQIGNSRNTGSTTTLIANGGGTLTVNNPATNGFFNIGGVHTSTTTTSNRTHADFSGLSALNITLNTTTGTVRVSPTSGTNTANRYSTMYLPSTGAGNSTIIANALNVGDGVQNNGSVGQINTLRLGTGTNTLQINTINIGTGSRDLGAILFDPANTTGSINIYNAAGSTTSGGAALNIANGGGGTGVNGSQGNTFDVRGHNANLRFTNVLIGTQNRGTNAASTVTSANTFGFDTGSLTMTDLVMSVRTAQASGTIFSAFTTSTMFLGGTGDTTITNGILKFGDISGVTAGDGAKVTANLMISGGTVSIGNTGGVSIPMARSTVTGNTAEALLEITGGVTTLTGDITKVGGAGSSTATVTLNGGTLNMSGKNIGGATAIDNLNFQTGTLMNVGGINNGVGFTKLAAGTLTLAGNNTYTGPTAVNAGTLKVNGTLSASTVSVGSGATLGGGGSIGGATVVSTGGNLSPGNSPGQLTFSNGLTLASGSNFNWELSSLTDVGAGTNWDQVVVTNGALNIQPSVNFVLAFTGSASSPAAIPFWNANNHRWNNVFNVNGTGTIASGAAGFAPIDNTAWSGIGSFSIVPAVTGTGVDLVWTAANVSTTGTTYTLAAAPGTLNILKGGNLAATSTITNTGLTANNADTLTFTNLTGTSNDTAKATVTGSSNGGPLANGGGSAVQNLNIKGLANGNATITSGVTTAKNTTSNTDATLSGTAGTINVVVGNASFDGTNSSTTFGAPLSTLVAGATNYDNSTGPLTAGWESNSINATVTGGGPAKVGTTATIVRYDNSSGGAETVSMAWRSRTTTEADLVNNPKALLSDVVRITGMGPANTNVGTFVLEMTYDLDQTPFSGLNETAIAISGELQLGWFNPNTNQWVNAIAGNIGGATPGSPVLRAPTGSDPLGTWGIDTSAANGKGYVWAVLNHNSDFAVIPEPSTFVLGGLALLGFAGVGLRRRRNKATTAETV